ncbi:MAG: PEP-CTERM sorting domain-containing protein [Pseudomonadota bacterium]
MKTKIKFFIFLAVLFLAKNTFAFSFTQDYWTPTDFTTGDNGSAFFVLSVEIAGYESDFGLFTVDDITNPATIVEKLLVFEAKSEPFSVANVYFKQDSDGWWAKSDFEDWQLFDRYFGFYYGVYTGGATDTTLDYLWYTDTRFNSYANGTPLDTTIEHIATDWNGIDTVSIYLDDQRGGGDRDWNDMTIIGNDMAPVPEPATLLLLGTGLLGLGVGRKKISKK